jgi:undecaprenyl-diphosphatase
MVQDDKLKALEMMIQFFAILAILFIYKDKVGLKHKKLWLKTFVAFLPLGIIGFIFSDFIKSLFDIKIVAIMFIIGGVAFLFAEKIYEKNKKDEIKTIDDINYFDSFKIGLFQILSFLPGTSRSGATIFGGMFLGIDRKLSSEFSFLLAVPVTFSVFAYDFLKNYQSFSLDDF